MSNLNTELMTALLKNESIDEVFRSHLEAAMNDLLKIELTQFLGYEKSSILGYNTRNSRNGFYERDLDTSYGRLHIKVPRDRNGYFEQQLIPSVSCPNDMLSFLWMSHILMYVETAWLKSRSTCFLALRRMEPEKFWITHSIRRRPQRLTRR